MSHLRIGIASNTEQDMLTPDQLRAARALVKWSREDLADKSGVAAVTIKGFELLGADSKISTLNKLRRALEVADITYSGCAFRQLRARGNRQATATPLKRAMNSRRLNGPPHARCWDQNIRSSLRALG
jgi:transcriptional regulator with XRE-family HTH domain